MKAWSTAVFPITVLSTLAALSFWLLHATSLDEVKADGKNRHDPDYVIKGMRMNKLDKTGKLQYTLTADQVVHFPDDDSTEVAKPYLVYLSPGKPPLNINSRTAQISSEGETVHLAGEVRIRRDEALGRPALNGYMDDLTVQTDDETAETDSPVRFTHGASWLKGVGLRLDNKVQTYVLQSQAVGQFESRKAKARTAPAPAAAPAVVKIEPRKVEPKKVEPRKAKARK